MTLYGTSARGGVRPLPPLITKPYHLSSFTRLLGKSTLKSLMFEQLQRYGHLPPSTLEKEQERLGMEARMQERLLSTDGGSGVTTPSLQSVRRPDDSVMLEIWRREVLGIQGSREGLREGAADAAEAEAADGAADDGTVGFRSLVAGPDGESRISCGPARSALAAAENVEALTASGSRAGSAACGSRAGQTAVRHDDPTRTVHNDGFGCAYSDAGSDAYSAYEDEETASAEGVERAFAMQFTRVAELDRASPQIPASTDALAVTDAAGSRQRLGNAQPTALALAGGIPDAGEPSERWWRLKDRYRFVHNHKLYFIDGRTGQWCRRELPFWKPKRRSQPHRVLRRRREVRDAKRDVALSAPASAWKGYGGAPAGRGDSASRAPQSVFA